MSAALASADESPYSHKALFAPNETYPYFQSTSLPPHLEGQSFSLEAAQFLAESSLLAYVEDRDFTRSRLEQAGFPQTLFFDIDGTYAFLAINEYALALAFRGSETADKTDYTTDAKIIQTPFREFGTAHSGFVQALDRVRGELDTQIDRLLEERPRTLWITGHSLGAALATLYGIHRHDVATAVYTMGGPRVGGVAFVKNVEGLIPLFRLVNDNDIIPRLPTPPFYRHFGTIEFITSEGELLENPPFTRKWESRVNGHASLIEDLYETHWKRGQFKAIPIDYIVDHSPRRYAEALAAIEKRP